MAELKDISHLSTYPAELYDIYLFSSGFEERSSFIFSTLEVPFERCLVLGFNDDLNTLNRWENDKIFKERGVEVVVCEDLPCYEKTIQKSLIAASQRVGTARPLRVFVDYSTMTRAWYGYLLTWAKYSQQHPAVHVDLFYAFGEYQRDFEPMHIKELCSVAGFEGHSSGARRTNALLGLGFDRYATLAVCDQIEPDSITCFVAKESETDSKAIHVIEANREIIDMSTADPVALPLGNVSEAFRLMYEYASFYGADDEIVAVPMGPKTHVLASLILCQMMPRVSCLHARGFRANPVPVKATGQVVGCALRYS